MIIYYSIILWFLLMWFCYCASARGRVHNNLPIHQQINRVPWELAILTFGYLTFWVGMRTGWGDTYAYNTTFRQIEVYYTSCLDVVLRQEKGWGFHLITYVFHKYISGHLNVWYMFLGILSCGCVAYTFKKYSPHFFLSAIIYILSCSFAWSMNGIRQYFCVTILFTCLPLILRKRWIPLAVIIILLSFIHTTALIMIPIVYIVQYRPWNKMSLLAIAVTSSIVCFPGMFSDGVETVLEGSSYEGMTEKFGVGVNIIRVLFFSLPAVIAYWKRKKIEEQNNSLLDVCVNMSILTACLYFIGSVTSGILVGRLPIYCQLYSYILIAYEAKLLFSPKTRFAFIFGYLLIFFLFFVEQTKDGRYYYRSDLTGLLY